MRDKLRCYGSLVLSGVLLTVASWLPPVAAYAVTIAAFVLMFEGGLSLYERVSRTGGMKDYHQ